MTDTRLLRGSKHAPRRKNTKSIQFTPRKRIEGPNAVAGRSHSSTYKYGRVRWNDAFALTAWHQGARDDERQYGKWSDRGLRSPEAHGWPFTVKCHRRPFIPVPPQQHKDENRTPITRQFPAYRITFLSASFGGRILTTTE